MAWVYLDDQFPDHPKVARAGGDAGWLFVCGLAYCKRYNTGGRIPRGQVPQLTDRRRPFDLAAILVGVVLWEVDDVDYLVHDYGEWNRPTEARSEQGRKAAKARWAKERNAPGNAPGNARADAAAMPEQMRSDALSLSLTDVPIAVDLRGLLARPSPPLLEEAEAMIAGLRVIHGSEPVAAALAGLGNARFAWPKDLRLALERTLGPNKPPDPTEATAAAAGVIYARNEARRNSKVCQRCAGDGRILPPGEDVAEPCPDCTPPRLRAVP